MRYLVLSDIHANLDALDAVLASAATEGWDKALVLGDLVGYGADPNGVIAKVRGLPPAAIIRGNHDKAACGVDDASTFNPAARLAAQWTYEALTPEHRDYLRALPAGPLVIDGRVEIWHGAPEDEDEYIFDGPDAWQALEMARTSLCFFGHTHVAVVFHRAGDRFEAIVPEQAETVVRLERGRQWLINPGSVGQPRDGDPRAAYAVYDDLTEVVVMRRITYPVATAQEKIVAAGLPAALANRLSAGR